MHLAGRLVVAFSLVFASTGHAAERSAARPSSPARSAETGFILKLRPGNRFLETTGALRSRAPGLDRALDRIGAREAIPVFPPDHADLVLREKLGLDRYYVIRLDHPADTRSLVADLARSPDVESVERLAGASAVAMESVTPNDSSFADQWALRNTGTNVDGGRAGADIKATDAWDVATGDSGIVVAVLDTGIRLQHPDLAPRLWTNRDEIPGNGMDDDGNGFVDDVHGYNMAYDSPDIGDRFGHGTAVSSIVGAATDNRIGIAGVDWKCKVMMVAVLDDRGFGTFDEIASGVFYAANNGAHVLSMSLAGEEPSDILDNALQYAAARGCFIAVAMGNDGSSFPSYPAAYPEVFAVGATDARDVRAFFSSFGNHIDAVAPGVAISTLSAFDDSTIFRVSGTSASTPLVSGLASLLIAHRGRLRPEVIRNIIEVTADDGVGDPIEDMPGWDPYYGYGRINCDRALRLEGVPHPPLVTAPHDVSGVEESTLRIDVSVSDVDGSAILSLTADLSGLPPGHTATFTTSPDNRRGTLTWTPTLTEAGQYRVVFIASDPLRGSASTVITIANLNQAPALTAPATVDAREQVDLLFTVRGSDPDEDLLSLSAADLPANARFSDNLDNTGFVAWQPALGQAGTYRVSFLADDGHGASASAATEIQVGTADHPPIINAPAEVRGDEGSSIGFGVTASDPDGEWVTLSLDLGILPPGHGASFTVDSGGGGTFSWTPAFDAAGTYTLVVTAANARTSTAAVLLTVGNVDRAPIVTAPSSATAAESEAIDVLVGAADPDGDPIQSLTAGPLPAGATFEAASGNASGHVRWTPGFDQAGTYQVTLSAASASRASPASAPVLLGTAMLEIRVGNVNRAPAADAGGPYAGVFGVGVQFEGGGSSDPDGDALRYSWAYGDGGAAEGVRPVHTYAAPGEYIVTLRVADGFLTGEDATSASITGTLAANAFLLGEHRTVSLASGSSALTVLLQPADGSFEISDLDLSSLRLVSEGTGEVSEIAPESDKTSAGGDRNRDGILEVAVSFRKSDLRLLFGHVTGRTTVPTALEGALVGGVPVRAPLDLVIVGGRSGASVSLSPNPLRASGTVTVRSTRDGAVRVRLFDCHGRFVRTLTEGWRAAGYHDVSLDRRDGSGARLTSGIYFLRAETPDGVVVDRVAIVK